MIRTLLKVGILLVIGLIGYNYFFGNETEKAQSREMVGKVRDIGGDAWDLLKTERQKMRDGKYDDALDKLDGLYTELRKRAQNLRDSRTLERLRELDERRAELEEVVREDDKKLSREAKRKLDNLTADTEDLMNEMEAKNQLDAPR